MPTPELLFFFFLIAAAYASAGFGGGSSYLAAMAVLGLSMAEMRPASLLCNIVVTAGGSLVFWQKGLLDWRRTWPLAASIPAAWVGARWPISEPVFLGILGSSLIVAGGLLAFQKNVAPIFENAKTPQNEPQKPFFIAILGSGLGFLAGLTGLGGGIFLAPALHFLRFDSAKKIAATASVFILVNSLAGLSAGIFSKNWAIDGAFVGPLAVAVALGGQLGSRFSAGILAPRHVRWATAALVLYAGFSIWRRLL